MAGCLVAVIALVVALAVGRPTLIELVVLAPESVAIAVTAYVVGLRPLMETSPDGIVVRNCLRTTPLRWADVQKVVPERIGLVLYTPHERLPVSAVPDAGRRINGRPRSEVVAEELATSVATATGSAVGTVLGSRPTLSPAEQRRERIAVMFGLIVVAIWVLLTLAGMQLASYVRSLI